MSRVIEVLDQDQCDLVVGGFANKCECWAPGGHTWYVRAFSRSACISGCCDGNRWDNWFDWISTFGSNVEGSCRDYY